MLNTYKAIDIIGVISEYSGRTKPWIVLAETANGIEAFVVKLFTTNQIETSNSLLNEVIGNALAREFDLNVPSMALIDIPESLVLKKSAEVQHQFYESDERLKFASIQLSNVKTALKELPKTFYKKRLELDTLYAFDNMIRNADRGQIKTNLLINKEAAFLIDHELAFNISEISELKNTILVPNEKFSKYHLFYSFLKKGKDKDQYFEEFREHLNHLNLSKLSSYYNCLEREGFNSNSNMINTWLLEIQRNSNIFVNNLRITLK